MVFLKTFWNVSKVPIFGFLYLELYNRGINQNKFPQKKVLKFDDQIFEKKKKS